MIFAEMYLDAVYTCFQHVVHTLSVSSWIDDFHIYYSTLIVVTFAVVPIAVSLYLAYNLRKIKTKKFSQKFFHTIEGLKVSQKLNVFYFALFCYLRYGLAFLLSFTSGPFQVIGINLLWLFYGTLVIFIDPFAFKEQRY